MVARSVRFDPIRKEVAGYKMDATAHHLIVLNEDRLTRHSLWKALRNIDISDEDARAMLDASLSSQPWSTTSPAASFSSPGKQGRQRPVGPLESACSMASCSRQASTLSIVLPSMSTISKRQPPQLIVSASLGSRPVSSIIMPLSVW